MKNTAPDKAKPFIIRDRLYVPDQYVNWDDIRDFEVTAFHPKNCKYCPHYAGRPVAECGGCRNFLGNFKFYEEMADNYVSFSRGNIDLLKKVVPKLHSSLVDDQRKYPYMGFEFELTKTPYDYQVEAVDKMSNYTGGILQSPARSGKTLMAVMLVQKLKTKTMIIAHQIDLLEQFLKTFHEFTNILEIEAQHGKPLVQIARKPEDLTAPVVLVPYQMFISAKGKRYLQEVYPNFGMIIIDECHRAPAECFARVVNGFPSRYRYGLSATPYRKDNLHFINGFIIGPVRHEVKIKTLMPTVEIIETHENPKREFEHWAYAMRWLVKNNKRNQLILDYVIKDIQEKRSILIPVTQRQHTQELVKLINHHFGATVAAGFDGSLTKKQRVEVLEKATSGEISCVVGMRSMLTGINIPRWSVVYEIMPMANIPNAIQEFSRPLTFMDGKPTPIIRFFVESKWELSRCCLIACMPALKLIHAVFPEATREVLKTIYRKQNKQTDFDDDTTEEQEPEKRDRYSFNTLGLAVKERA